MAVCNGWSSPGSTGRGGSGFRPPRVRPPHGLRAAVSRSWIRYCARGEGSSCLRFCLPETMGDRKINYVGMSLEELSAMPTPWTPTSVLAQAVYLAGFLYDPDQDIIYSRMDALQRNFGYAFGYDAAALAMNAVIDCEPVFFDYDGKHWMIELWKGQYGLETGCEIGVYTRP